MYKMMITDCAAKEGAPQSDLDAIFNRQVPTTPQGLCIGACVGDASGMVSQSQIEIDEHNFIVYISFKDQEQQNRH